LIVFDELFVDVGCRRDENKFRSDNVSPVDKRRRGTVVNE
jgi:hypothetical protein